jgi:hypothetical protein
MKNIKLDYFIYALVGISFLIYIGILYFQPVKDQSLYNYVKIIPTVVSIDVAISLLFAKYLWKLSIFKGWLIPFPNLNGTWKGMIHSNWVNPETGKNPDPIPVILTINQSLFHISCVMRTKEMTSHSFISGFSIDDDNQIKRLSYSYNSKPKQSVRHRSPEHFGTIVFDIVQNSSLKLVGEYWTERTTTGSINMEYWKSEKLDNFPEELGIHPVSGK